MRRPASSARSRPAAARSSATFACRSTAQDFSPYVQRIKDAHPQAIFAFLTVSGAPFLKAWDAAGGPATGVKILATGDLTAENNLPVFGDAAIGHDHVDELCRRLTPLAAQRPAHPGHAAPPIRRLRGLISAASRRTTCCRRSIKSSRRKTVTSIPTRRWRLVRGMKIESPRGPIQIDPQTRDIVQNIYIRRVEKVDGKYQNTEIAVLPERPRPTREVALKSPSSRVSPVDCGSGALCHPERRRGTAAP